MLRIFISQKNKLFPKIIIRLKKALGSYCARHSASYFISLTLTVALLTTDSHFTI